MDYFYLKLGTGNHLATDWLSGKNPLKRPAAVVFFDNLLQSDYESGQGNKQSREFITRASAALRGCTLMVVVNAGEVWVLKPADEAVFLPSQVTSEGYTLTPKVVPVEVIARRSCKDVPPVLAGIGSNQYFGRGTFRRINDWGNFKAVDCVAGRACEGEHWNLAKNGPNQLLECLGSTELETLVARLLEAQGCFVPAHRGGVMKDIDLFAYNDSAKQIQMGSFVIPPRERASVQVKRWAEAMKCPAGVDCLVGLGVTGPKTINADKLLSLVQAAPSVMSWLQRSLGWLPREFLAKFGLGATAPTG